MHEATILYVDPNAGSREIHGVLLRALGYRAVCAESEDEALRLLGAERPRVVLTELFRPPPDGFAFVRRLAAGDAPVIVLSAYVFPEDRAQAAVAGASAFLAMPCPVERMQAVLARIAGTGAG